MKLRNELSIVVWIIWGLLVLAAYIGSQQVIKNSFLQLEQKQVRDTLSQVKAAIQQMENALSTTVTDWSVWDDTYRFVGDKNQAYIKANQTLGTYSSVNVSFMLFFDASGKLVYSRAVNSDATQFVPLPEGLSQYLSPKGKLVYQPGLNSGAKGLVHLPSGIYFVASHAITTSNRTGPVHGTLVLGRLLNESTMQALKELTQVDLSLHKVSSLNSPAMKKVYGALLGGQDHLIQQKNEKNITGFTTLNDVNDKPIAILEVDMGRNVYLIGLKTIWYYNGVFLVYSVFLVLGLFYLLNRLIVRRIEKLSAGLMQPISGSQSTPDITTRFSDEVSSIEALYNQAMHDPLTGIANRSFLYQRFKYYVDNKPETKIGILFLDLDYFKRVNDSLGHEVGDTLLTQVADQIKACIRPSDVAARLGGDEFVVMLVDSDNEQTQRVLDRLYKRFLDPFMVDSHELYLSISMGISQYPDDGSDLHTLLKQADIALYRAKEAGRSHYQYYSSAMQQRIQDACQQEIELQKAIDHQELCLHYQPIYDIKTAKIVSVEALLRWQHPEKGLLNASEIIPIAEKSGLIIPIGRWVLNTACNQVKSWQVSGLPIVPVTVNLSVQQTKHTSLVELVMEALEKSGLSAQYLELELTETGFIEITSKVLSELQALRAMGVQLAVDDFGAGYSGLGCLKRLPASKIKIDRTFIKDVLNDEDDRAIVNAIILIAHQLKKQVIAEGVETDEQYQYLKNNNVDAAQGNYLAPPVSAAQCESLLVLHQKISSTH